MRLTMRKLAIYAALLLVAVLCSTAAALVAFAFGAANDTARWVAFVVLLLLAVGIAILVEVRFR